MARKVKATKTTTKKKEKAAKSKPQEGKPHEHGVEAPAGEVPKLEVGVTSAPESPRADVPTVAPSVAMTTRKVAAVPATVREEVTEPESRVASPEPMVTGPPLTGILAILKVETEAEAGVTLKNLEAYRAYLQTFLEKPVRVRGREPFGWERPYAWGLRDQAAYERRRALCPSYLDELEIVGFEEELDLTDGIRVQVSRPSDGKSFVLGLVSLQAADPAAGHAPILDEFFSWFTQAR